MTPRMEGPPGLTVKNTFNAITPDEEDDGELEIPEAEDPGYQPKPMVFHLGQENSKKTKVKPVARKSWKKVSWAQSAGHVMPLIAEPLSAPVNALSGPSWLQVDPATGWRKVKSVMDSGASECCAPPDIAPEQEIQDSEGSKRGQKYTAAGGKSLDNLGEKTMPMMTEEGMATQGTWQMVEVVRPLNSVRQICKRGNRVIFGLNGGEIQNIHTGEVTRFGVEDNIYTLDLWLPPVGHWAGGCVPCGGAQGFTGQGWRS